MFPITEMERKNWYFYQNHRLDQLIQIRVAVKSDAHHIADFYMQLNDTSKAKFAPHDFKADYLSDQILENSSYIAVIAENTTTKELIGYAVTQLWIFDYDIERWATYEIRIDNENKKFACIAPAVSLKYQYAGVGTKLVQSTIRILKEKLYKDVLLWGGVKCQNVPAVQFYLKNGFKLIGHFEYQGGNYDMHLKID